MAYTTKFGEKILCHQSLCHSITHSNEWKNRKNKVAFPAPLISMLLLLSSLLRLSPSRDRISATRFPPSPASPRPRGKGPYPRDLRRRCPASVSPSRESTVAGIYGFLLQVRPCYFILAEHISLNQMKYLAYYSGV